MRIRAVTFWLKEDELFDGWKLEEVPASWVAHHGTCVYDHIFDDAIGGEEGGE